ncbi:MAG: hypothetical protein IKC03_02240 [Oscillospiraceae bacterium]|nr:hypothetical protein [Oscillospiraceae bacterium]
MRRRIAVLFLVLVLFLMGCSTKYYADDFVGKTSKEIEQEFGSFDCIGMPVGKNGLYRNCQCGYTIKEARKGFLGTTPEVLFFISFDENGIAIACEEGYRPGG